MRNGYGGLLFAFVALLISANFTKDWGVLLGGAQTLLIIIVFYYNNFFKSE